MDANLFDLLHANEFRGLSESYVRIFSIQMLNSLNFLSTMKIVHCDIKPENFVLKTWGKSGIKLIDFGTSCYQGMRLHIQISKCTPIFSPDTTELPKFYFIVLTRLQSICGV